MAGLRGAERDGYHAFARERIHPSVLARDAAACFDKSLWLRLGGRGLFCTAPTGNVPVAARAIAGLVHGGLDAPLGLSAVAQWIAGCLISSFGNDGQRQRFLPRVLSGESIVAVCNAETGTGTQLKSMRSCVHPDPVAPQDSDRGLASIDKSSASNLGLADVALVSAWKHGADPKQPPHLEVFILQVAPPLVQESHVQALAGFRSGLTGALRAASPIPISMREAQLGPDGSGPQILRLCFHLERLLIGALLCGVIDGLFDEARHYLRARETHDPQFVKHQYVQEKLTQLYSLGRRSEGLLTLALQGLLERPEQPLAAALEEMSALLSVIKLTAVEDSLLATSTAYELYGYPGFFHSSFVQKAHRDLLAFKMLGGSKELLKLALFRDLAPPALGQPA
jgi:alkylation response protein AidB-like acyl-CoA dehydrogenase